MTRYLLYFVALAVAVICFVLEYGIYHSTAGGNTHRKRGGHKHGEGLALDQYVYVSGIRSWNPAFKITLSFLMTSLAIALSNPYVSTAIILAMAYITVVKGGLPFTVYLSLMTIFLSFLILSTFTMSVDFSKSPMGQYNINLGFCYVFTSMAQLKEMLHLILKVFAAVSSLQMMTLSTPSNEIIAFLRKIHVPKLMIELMNLIYRFIFILLEVHGQMKNSAGARLGYCDFRTSCRTFGNIASNMLVLSLKRANEYYNAMEARCYDGEIRFLEEEKRMKPGHIICGAIFIAFLFLLWGFM